MTTLPTHLKQSDYGIHRNVRLPYARVVERVREELQKEGFGIITEIDVQATFKKKLDVDFRPYIILGACAPKAALQALNIESDVGLLLPCNVVVQEVGAGVDISAIKPTTLFERLVQNAEIAELARDIEARLTRAVERTAA